MKTILLIASVATLASVALAQTNIASTNSVDFNKHDLAFSLSGTSYNGHNEVGLDAWFSFDPIEQLPDLWLGVSQSIYWQPAIAASTDIDVAWNVHIYGNVYASPGWSAGNIYGANSPDTWRTGPELLLQYYLSDKVFVYGSANYDLITKSGSSGWVTSGNNNGLRWGFGIGLEF